MIWFLFLTNDNLRMLFQMEDIPYRLFRYGYALKEIEANCKIFRHLLCHDKPVLSKELRENDKSDNERHNPINFIRQPKWLNQFL